MKTKQKYKVKYQNNKSNNKIIKYLLIKTLICLNLFMLFLIGIKKIEGFDKLIYNNIYSHNISFAKFNSLYKKYLGNLFPIKEVEEIQVFNDTLDYIKKEKYLSGVKLTVNDNYLIPVLNDGIVTFIGEKDNYGTTVIIQDETGLETWYSNIDFGNITLYEYVKKGDYLGTAKENTIILSFEKKGEFLSYEEYI